MVGFKNQMVILQNLQQGSHPWGCSKMGQRCEDRGKASVYSWWYRMKKHPKARKNRGGKEATNVSTCTNRGWCAPSWLHNMKCQQGHTEICVSPAVTCESHVRRWPQVSRRYSEETAGLASVTQIRTEVFSRVIVDCGPILNTGAFLYIWIVFLLALWPNMDTNVRLVRYKTSLNNCTWAFFLLTTW